MKIFGFDLSLKKVESKSDINPTADVVNGNGYGYRNRVFTSWWDGVKNEGEAGPIIRYITDHYALRYRSEQLYKESEITRAIIDKTVKWTIDRSLKLKSDPKIKTLAANGITLDPESFSKPLEELWEIYTNSTLSDYCNEVTLGELSADILRRALVGGDILIVNRVGDDGFVKKQLIDGAFVVNPMNVTYNGVDNIYPPTGNRVRNGVEIDNAGKQVAYHIRYNYVDTERISAYGKKTGIRMAYLVYGVKNAERGMPLIAAIIEMSKKMERYLGATLAGAEARAQIDYFIETAIGGSNENAFLPRGAIASLPINPAVQNVNDNLAVDINGIALANKILATTNHTAIPLPIGQTLKSVDSKQEANVPEYGGFIIDVMCAVCDIPPDVAMSKYNGSFSSSRMSAKDGERSFGIRRERYGHQDLDRTLELQMYVWVNQFKVNAPGYLNALKTNNQTVIQAYLFCRWVGSRFPDIDPLKTVKYLREAMGTAMAHVPLMTAESASEEIEQGDWQGILAQAQQEFEGTEDAGIPREDASLDDLGGGGDRNENLESHTKD